MTKLDLLLNAAHKHGMESEQDHEVGDLHEILRSCWVRLTPQQRKEVFEEHIQKVEDWT